MKKGGLYAKMPLLVAPDKIFFFPRFRDESTNAGSRKEHWTATCKKAALRMKRLLSAQRKSVAESQSTGPNQPMTPGPASAQVEPGEGSCHQQPVILIDNERSSVDPLQIDPSHDETRLKNGLEQPLEDLLEGQQEMVNNESETWMAELENPSYDGPHIEHGMEQPLEILPENQREIAYDQFEIWKADKVAVPSSAAPIIHEDGNEDFAAIRPSLEPLDMEVDYGTQAASNESSVDTEARKFARECLEDGSEDDFLDHESEREISPGISSFWTCHLCIPGPELDEVKQETKPDILDIELEVKHEVKSELLDNTSGLHDIKVKDEVKPDHEEEKPKPELKIHPFFEQRPDPKLDPRREISSSTPSTARASTTAFDAELLKSPTDVEWKTIEEKTDSVRAACGLTFDPLDILLVQRFLAMRKINFPEETVKDLIHLLHYKLYSLQPPKTSSARVKLVKGVIEDMVVLHYGRCLDRGKMGGVKKEEDGGEASGQDGGSILLG